MHDPAAVWIEVNVKETQLRRLARGQKVRITRVDGLVLTVEPEPQQAEGGKS